MAGSFTTFSPTLGSAPVQGAGPTGPWARAHEQDSGLEAEVDFELRCREEFPFSVSEDLPHAIASSISGGKP